MKEEIKNLWIEALRNGKYTQGQRYLNSENNFCCLGVLCEVAIKNGLEMDVLSKDKIMSYDNNVGILPNSVREWSGIQSVTGNYGKRNSLVDLNDKENKTFNEIADVIDLHWKEM